MNVFPKTIALALLLGFLLIPLSRTASAHPHVYVDASLTFVVDDNGLAGLRQHWLFDEIFSNAIMADVGLTPETLYSPMGQAKIREGAFSYLSNFEYFTFIETNGEQRAIPQAEEFEASMQEGRLAYEFFIPLNIPFDQIKNFRAAIFDKDYYSDILLIKDALAFEINGSAQVSHAIRPAKDKTYWQFIVPEAIHLSVTAPGGASDISMEELAEAEPPSIMERVMSMVREVQKELTLTLNGLGMDIKDDPFGPALWMFLGFSFLYGIVHAVGPGHGKTVVCSYFMANPGSLYTGALMGNVITFVHMGSAAVAVAVAYLIFSTGMGGFAAASRELQPASYALLALMGVALFIKAVVDIIKRRKVDASCPAHGQGEDEQPNTKRVLLVSFITGLIPCPGAAVILAFSIGQNILWAGIGAILIMAVGMGITTTLFAWAAVAARSATLKVSSVNTTAFNWLYGALSLCGAGFIAVFGATLFMSSTAWH